MNVKTVPIDSVQPDPANARKHGPLNMDALKSSLARFGQQKPIVVDKNGVVRAGNGTLEAAKALGWTEINVVVSDLDGVELTAYAIADNRTAELAEWDSDVLAATVQSMRDADADTEGLGFTPGELEDLFKQAELAAGADADAGGEGACAGEVVEDEAPEPQAEAFSRTGDLWLMGEHRVLCGDSTKRDDVDVLVSVGCVDMLLSDPPYGVSYVGRTKDSLRIQNDDLPEGDLENLIKGAFDCAEYICRGGSYWYSTVPSGPLHLLFASDWKARGILRQVMVWVKDSMVLGHSEYHYRHEPILFGWKPGKRHKNSDRTRTTVWEYPRPKRSEDHPTMKPVALWAQAVNDGSRDGEIVYDPFLGSGTTVIACEQLNRKCYGIEIEPRYVDVIVRRWEKFTGKKATLKRDGETIEAAMPDLPAADTTAIPPTTKPSAEREGEGDAA